MLRYLYNINYYSAVKLINFKNKGWKVGKFNLGKTFGFGLSGSLI